MIRNFLHRVGNRALCLVWLATFALPCLRATADPVSPAAEKDTSVPTVWLIGDSTVRNGTRGQMGWGDRLQTHLEPTKVKVENRALGGRSSRTFRTEGLWEKVRQALRPGDFVIMQFGHNDGGPMDTGRARASIKGNGEETRDVVLEATGKPETVHSYGWYLRQYAAEARAAGAVPVILSPIPRNLWKDGKMLRAAGDYGRWAKEAAEASDSRFIDFNDLVAAASEAIGQEATRAHFAGDDHTHTNEAGAAFNAKVLARALADAGLTGLSGAVLPSP